MGCMLLNSSEIILLQLGKFIFSVTVFLLKEEKCDVQFVARIILVYLKFLWLVF